LFTFALSRNLERNVLECNGNYYIADLVTKIIRGVFSSLCRHTSRFSKEKWLPYSLLGSLTELDKSNELTFEPEELFFTSSGRIGVIVDAPKTTSLHLTELQRNMAAFIPSVGGISHTRFVVDSFSERENTTVIHVEFTDSEHQKALEAALIPIRHLLASSMGTFSNDCSPF